LTEHIKAGQFPKWELHVQLLPVEVLDAHGFDPLDPTKVWPESLYPLHKVGTMTLNRNPDNYFAEVEQSAFSPSALVPGIEPSEDRLLQGRLFSYPDTQRYRLGANYLQIPVNCPYAPVRNHQRDGLMNVRQDASPVNYEPNSHTDSPKEDAGYAETMAPLQGRAGRAQIAKTDDFTQAGEQYRSYTPEERDHLLHNLVGDLKQTPQDIQLRAICNFFRADREYGMRLAEGLGIDIAGFMPPTH
jgi:catalase